MCLSRLGQIIYGALALAIAALICASMFTTGWRKFEPHLANGTMALLQTGTVDVGLFSVFCANSFSNTTTNSSNAAPSPQNQNATNALNRLLNECTEWFMTELPTWNKVVVAAMILALLFALVAFIWNLLTFCACFCHAHIAKPLPGLAALTGVLLVVALVAFYTNNDIVDITKSNITTIGELKNFLQGLGNSSDTVGYSFYLGCGAAIASFANVVIGVLIVCLADRCL